jgi:membrane-bound ClpP family serine protease
VIAAIVAWMVGTLGWASAAEVVAIPPERAARSVAILPVRGPMDAITVDGISDRIDRARQDGADCIVLAFDTPGGELTSTLDLCRRIKGEFPPNTIAWIAPQAFSAGTIAALACREIVVTPDAVFGDAAPIAALPGLGLQALPATERAKIEAPLLSEVTDSARRRGHDERLCRAFVSAPIALWLLEDPVRGERYVVDGEEYRAVFGLDPGGDMPMLAVTPGAPLLPWITDALRRPNVTGQSDADLEASQRLPPGRVPLTAADRDRLRLVSRLDTAEELLTLRADEAMALGLAKARIADTDAFRTFTGATTVTVHEPRWSEGLARILTSWWFRGLLILALVTCFVGEMMAPGLGVFSLVGVGAAVLLVISPALYGLADWWPAAVILAGLALLAVEILLFPGTLVAGIAGALAFALGTVGLFVISDPSPDPRAGVARGLITLAAAITMGGFMLWWMGRARERGGLASGVILQAELTAAGIAAADASSRLLGAEGVAVSDLRPAGRVDVAGVIRDARSEGWIDRGSRVRVIGSAGGELLVERLA